MSDKGLELLNKLFYSSGEGIMFFDKDGKIATVNPRAEQMFGYSEQELQGRPVEVLIPKPLRVNHIKSREGFVKNPHPRQMGAGRDLDGLRKNGSTFPLEISLSYIQHENETLIVAFITDITIRKENERRLEKQRIQLREYTEKLERKVKERTSELEHLNLGLQSQIQERKLAEIALKESVEDLKKAEEEILKTLNKERELGEMKSRFVSMASHEFRTPLTTILSSANLIARYKDDQAARERHVEKISSSVHNLTTILNGFLSLERLESGAQKVVHRAFDLSELIEEVREEVQGMMKQDQSISANGDALTMISDPHILKNILLNLVSNAIKYSPEGGVVELNTSNGVECKITIKDNGIGIPEKDQKRLFERFHRAENAANIQGTGLGLHIVKKYVELLNGTITFESEEEKGSTFNVILPKNN
ncbi:MAG: PAS domain-containing sensor histidine kinase [Ekhidna sp.]|nr:PAS domain-containing sensor histidine kinase [Ekhidna sp.]MBC6408940.1 PAS domain-containing sensor histidine kinase [Ekhidna sp.]MBC6427370.1 PAS domain-containing sensor histidine kinase [Ekhidna sp.]